jgi:hypothetical protein
MMFSRFIGLQIAVYHRGMKKNTDHFIPRVKALADDERYVNMLWAPGLESTPLRKLRAFAHALSTCWSFFVSGIPSPFESGAVEITPCKIAFVIVALVSQRRLQ